MEQQFFGLALIIEGAAEKVSQFLMPIKSIYIKNKVFNLKNVFSNTTERSTLLTILKITIFIKLALFTFSEVPSVG